MRAVIVTEPGGPEVLTWAEVPDPVCGPGEVIVDATATAVNRADLLQRQGFYPPPTGASDVLGLECSGVISEVGEGVLGWSVGDEVCALLSGGGYAERVAVPAGPLPPPPPRGGVAAAGGLPRGPRPRGAGAGLGGGGPRPGGPAPPPPRRCRARDGGGAARGHLHRVVERLPPRRAAPRRGLPRPRWLQRHRHDGDPAGGAGRRPRVHHG